jgi:lysyl-tRNA synthetase class 2
VPEALAARADMLRTIRKFFEALDVVEVQTAVLARHGVTDPAIESIEMNDGSFLQASPEYQMKRLLAAGAPSIYQIGPAFRGGEVGRWHNREFTMLEWYRLAFDAKDLMLEVAQLIDLLLGPEDYEERVYASFFESDVNTALDDELDIVIGNAIAAMGPRRVFVTDYPPRQAAMARVTNNAAERFELVVNGVEIANGYHELIDVVELEYRMKRDNALRRERGLPEMVIDRKLIAAHRNGLPPCAGVAIGFDRLLALKLGASSLSEVMSFPSDRA